MKKKMDHPSPRYKLELKELSCRMLFKLVAQHLLPLLMLSSRSLAGDSSKGAVPVNLHGVYYSLMSYPATVELKHSTF